MLTRRSFFSAATGCAASTLAGGEHQPDEDKIMTITPNREKFWRDGMCKRTFERVVANDTPVERNARYLSGRVLNFLQETNDNSLVPFKPVSVAFAVMGGFHWLEVYCRCDSIFPDATDELLSLHSQRY